MSAQHDRLPAELERLLVVRPGPEPQNTVLTDLAWNFGQLRGLGASVIGLGLAALLAGASALISGSVAAVGVIILLVVGTLLGGAGLLVLRRARRHLPTQRLLLPGRGPQTLAGGWAMTMIMAALLGALLAPLAPALAGSSEFGVLAVGMSYAAMLLAVVSLFLLPARIASTARADFRAALARRAVLRRQLVERYRCWQRSDASSAKAFGPL